LEDRLRRAVAMAVEAGYQIDKEAFDLLKDLSGNVDPIQLMEKTLERVRRLREETFIIQRGLLEEVAEAFLPREETVIPEPCTPSRKPYAREVEADIKILQDPTGRISTKSSIEGYLEYFRDRFRRLQRLLRQRMDAKDAISISEALKMPANSKVKVIGMITEKREQRRRFLIRIEDEGARATVFVPPTAERGLIEKARRLVLDQVVCVAAVKGRNDLLIAEDFIWPDLPERKPNRAPIPVYAVLISDLHVGSRLFAEREFERFIRWLNGDLGDARLRELAGHVKYVVVAGDIVDGVGVYPEQIEELAIQDIYEQYRETSRLFGRIPDHVEILVIPGDHDATRRALPQPAIPKEYAEPLYEAGNVHVLGNPCMVSLHGVRLLLYHGRSLIDVMASVPGVNFQNPVEAMKVLLQGRHLAPSYGQRTPIAPEGRDFMVVEEEPDIFHVGHIHVLGHDIYRGTLLVSSGSWQRQTKYQEKMGLKPDFGVASVVNLQTLEVTPINFLA